MSGGFLGRWSRRKRAAAGKAAPAEAPLIAPQEAAMSAPGVAAATAPGAGEGAAAAVPPAVEVQLPAVEALTLDSDFTAFLKDEVGEALRRKALHKLFSDPHFNRMDGLDIYIDDYSQPDPIPPDVLARLKHAREWLQSDADEDAAGVGGGEGAVPHGDGVGVQGPATVSAEEAGATGIERLAPPALADAPAADADAVAPASGQKAP
ncbi:DUF3306 domain-containing protein [Thauera sp.]|uniref:DUF3306 domain-containing protein n=1 Tax=Thauera sp. TaxID=1905334 RepID=UPI00262D5692|nr:DUF3306 domain-containing protein [Thauera sp.]MCK6408518.1 DUF3306 domain-containing protein [Thauera sp.]